MPTSRFDQLQQRLVERLGTTTPEAAASTIVVCPSISFPAVELRKIIGIQFYEERLLFLTLLLRDPALEVIFPTSVPIDPAVIDYYLAWLPDPQAARARLHLFSVGDPRPNALTDKLLERPHLVAAIRDRIRDPDTSFMLPFNVTDGEARLAEALQVPIYGTHPDLVALGSKSGARHVAREAGVAVLDGAEELHSVGEIEDAIGRIRGARPHAQAVVVKLNNGFSGQGNLILPLDAVTSPLEQSSGAVFCASEESWDTFVPKIERDGAVVEELARAPGLTSPSVQVRILPDGVCEIVSTHDQILGGPDDQVYLGCRFPAREEYRSLIVDDAMRVARVLADRGVLGSFGIDFLVVPDRGVFLSEINLRLGGTTHPFLMSRYATGGVYDDGHLVVDGERRVYKGSDNVKSPRYVGLTPQRVIEAVAEAGLAYSPATRTGATLHLLGAMPEYGKFGLVCIAASHAGADELYEQVLACVDALAEA